MGNDKVVIEMTKDELSKLVDFFIDIDNRIEPYGITGVVSRIIDLRNRK